MFTERELRTIAFAVCLLKWVRAAVVYALVVCSLLAMLLYHEGWRVTARVQVRVHSPSDVRTLNTLRLIR